MMRSIIYILSFLLILNCNAYAVGGSPPTSPDAEIYHFFNLCAERGILPANISTIKLLSYAEVSSYLWRVADSYPLLSKDKVLVDDLNYFLREYAIDLKDKVEEQRHLRSVGWSPSRALENPHWRLFHLQNQQGYIIFDPVIGMRVDYGEKRIIRRGSGVKFYGRFHFLGYNFKFVDYTERGNGPYTSRDQLLEDRYGYVGPLLGGNETYYDINEAHLSLEFSKFNLIYGKGQVNWGPGHFSNLLLTSNATAFDRFQINIRINKYLRYSYLTGKLKDITTPTDTLYKLPDGKWRMASDKKWVAAHRLEYCPWQWLVVAINEAVVWGERGLDLAYINPLAFFYSAQHSGGDCDNVLMCGDFKIIYPTKGTLYGALLIDDMKTSAIGTSDIANKIGYLCGISTSSLGISGCEIGLEYLRLDPFVYTHIYPINRYTHWRANLGSDLKPNSDRLTLWGQYRLIRQLVLDCNISRNRHGTLGGSPEDVRPEGFDEKEASLLSGTRSNWIRSEVSLKWEFIPAALVQVGWINNDKNTFEPNRTYISLSYRI